MNPGLLRKTFNRVVDIINRNYDGAYNTISVYILNGHIYYSYNYLYTGGLRRWAPFAERGFLEDEMHYFIFGSKDGLALECSVFAHIDTWLKHDKDFPDDYYKLASLKDITSLEELELKLDILGL
jgi:hypothetical protein